MFLVYLNLKIKILNLQINLIWEKTFYDIVLESFENMRKHILMSEASLSLGSANVNISKISYTYEVIKQSTSK